MKKMTCALVVVFVLLLAGYAIGRRHHVAKIMIEPQAVDLLLVAQIAASDPQPSVLRASYMPQQTQTQGSHDPSHGTTSSKILDRYHQLRKAKNQNPGGGVTTEVDTWSTCVPDWNVKITFSLDDDPDLDEINITRVPAAKK